MERSSLRFSLKFFAEATANELSTDGDKWEPTSGRIDFRPLNEICLTRNKILAALRAWFIWALAHIEYLTSAKSTGAQ
jgi:hypothetical protein